MDGPAEVRRWRSVNPHLDSGLAGSRRHDRIKARPDRHANMPRDAYGAVDRLTGKLTSAASLEAYKEVAAHGSY